MELTLTAEPHQEPDGESVFALWCSWCHGQHVVDHVGWFDRLPCWRDGSPYADGVEIMCGDIEQADEQWCD